MTSEKKSVSREPLSKLQELKLAAAKGTPEAQYALAEYYIHSIEGRLMKAIELCNKASDKGYLPARFELGRYCLGEKVWGELSGHSFWKLESAAEDGYAPAQHQLGLGYMEGWFDGQEDYGEAEKWLEKAAEQNYPPAMLDYGDLIGCTACCEDMYSANQRINELWEKAAELGYIPAMVAMAEDYSDHNDAESVEKAHYWCRKAAEAGK